MVAGGRHRALRVRRVEAEFCVVGAGMAGLAAAVAAARRGVDTVLVGDRPVLGGNASKEIRVPVSGADGGANNRYARETGFVEELRLENLRRNPRGSAEMWDVVLLEKVLGQANLRVFLNTSVIAVDAGRGAVKEVRGVQLGTETMHLFRAGYFADCTGDGTVGYLAGARYMSGTEGRTAFGEGLAPRRGRRSTMGGSILFLCKDTGAPVEFAPPGWARCFSEEDLKRRPHGLHPEGDRFFWWVEYGGLQDTIHDNERIGRELLGIVYGLWDHLKNHPGHRAAFRTMDLEWVGAVPGKRENRRLVGDHVLTQDDLVRRTDFPDAVCAGGWSIDDHPPRGMFSRLSPSSHFHLPGAYGIPLRSLYSVNVGNLLFAGRDISASHLALCSARVMATCASEGYAVGAAVALALREKATPRSIASGPLAGELRRDLDRSDQYIVGMRNEDGNDLARSAAVSASSFRETGASRPSRFAALADDTMLMFPVAGRPAEIAVPVRAARPASLGYELFGPDPRGFFLPGPRLARGTVRIGRGGGAARIPLAAQSGPGFHWLMLKGNPAVAAGRSAERIPGIAAFVRTPQRGTDYRWWNRFSAWGAPAGWTLAFSLRPGESAYRPEAVVNGYSRPFRMPNLWIARPGFPQHLTLKWPRPVAIRRVQIRFDTDLEMVLDNLWVEYPFRAVPACVREYRLSRLGRPGWITLAHVRGNYQRLREHEVFARTAGLRLEILAANGLNEARVYEIRAYGAPAVPRRPKGKEADFNA